MYISFDEQTIKVLIFLQITYSHFLSELLCTLHHFLF